MTGFNHYSSCTCGWCINYGRSQVTLQNYENSFRERDAYLLLKSAGVKSISGCYINPNARCPRCDDPVFFYANSSGSRVYFDHLGPDWPKHWCTDSRLYRLADNTRFSPPTRRGKGEIKELLTAASLVGLCRTRTFGIRLADEWTPVEILTVNRVGNENAVIGEFLDSETNETFAFSCRSTMPILEVGDLISVNGNQISFVHRETNSPVTFTSGSLVDPTKPPLDNSSEPPAVVRRPPPEKKRQANQPTKKPSQEALTPQKPVLVAPSIRALPKPSTKQRRPHIKQAKHKQNDKEQFRFDMTGSEMAHFKSKKVPFEKLYGGLEPIIKMYAREGTRKPSDVATRLNEERFRTASGSVWTPRLARFLLALIFNNFSKDAPAESERKREARSTAKNHTDHTIKPASGMSRDDIADRLSFLGRVVRR